jgi:serine/threonine protein kinase/ActR/RegA family two-component response regulator
MIDNVETLLVVDDNEMNRDLLSRRLERKGYKVLTAADGMQALDTITTSPVDLVLLDVMMPGITGLDVLRAVREKRSPIELPIIMVTAKDESADIVQAFQMGANDYVTKPIDFPVVLARVQTQLRMKVGAAKPGAAPPGAAPPVSPAAAVAEVKTAAVLAGKYRIEAKLGAGAFGVVYRATHMALDHPVAVKILQHNVLLSDDRSDALARFRREGISTCRVNHPNAVTVIDFGVTDNGVAYLVMELLEGKTLAESLKENGTFSPSRCLEILGPICSVLEEAHASGVVHRDIKPANIFLHGIRGEEIVKVLDFGIAKLVGSASDEHATMTMEGSLLGTPAYMAPERVANQVYDGRADVYSVGVMLYQMLVGHPPFKAQDPVALAVQQMNATPPPPRDINPDVPPAVEAVVLEALVKDPDLRPTASLLAQRFASAVAISQSPDSHSARTTAGVDDPTSSGFPAPKRSHN